MTDNARCEDVRDLAPELALGISSGPERDAALRHLAGCTACRNLVGELGSVADEVLLLAPAHEPPVGFEDRVLARLNGPATARSDGSAASRRRRWMRPLAIAASLVLAAALGGGAVLRATSADRRLADSYRGILAEGQGSFFAVAPLKGTGAGTVWGYQGEPPWLFATLDVDEPGRYRVQLVTVEGVRMPLGGADLGAGRETWGAAIPVDLDAVGELRFEQVGGPSVLSATFDAQSPWE
jgi:anti-sigma factor RsiW